MVDGWNRMQYHHRVIGRLMAPFCQLRSHRHLKKREVYILSLDDSDTQQRVCARSSELSEASETYCPPFLPLFLVGVAHMGEGGRKQLPMDLFLQPNPSFESTQDMSFAAIVAP